jgi:hypothetical protein
MDARAIAIAAFSCCCLLSACSGGGGGPTPSVAPPSVTAATATPAPASTAAAPATQPSAYPLTPGNVLVYSGQLTQTYQSFPEVVAPGSPSPEPIASTLVNVTQNVTVSANQTFNGNGGLAGLHSAETDALASGLETTTATTDTYEALLANATTTPLLDFGSQYADESGDSVSTPPSPATTLDQIPEIAGAAWTNSPAATIDEAIAGNTTGSAVTVVRTINNDGSYNERTTYPPNYSAPGLTGVGNIQENADGSGSFGFVADGGATTITYSVPVPQPSGPPLITVNVYAALNSTGAPVETFQVPAWYGNAAPLYAETDRDDGVVSVPSACKLAAAFPAQATRLHRNADHDELRRGRLRLALRQAERYADPVLRL